MVTTNRTLPGKSHTQPAGLSASLIRRPAAGLLAAIALLLFVQTVQADIAGRKDVQAFIAEMVEKHQFDRDNLVKVFKQVETKKKIIEAITRPAESKPWYQYRPIFMTEKRISKGVEFWAKHAETLQRAEEEYGVPAQIIVAIIGVESFYGKHKGRYRVMDSLSTLAFDYPKRSSFFKSELKEFLLLAREEKTDPLSLTGSYAGAMGKPQFIASSYRHYAVDFDGDGKRDLLDNTVDVIGSVANYFKRHNWQRGEPIAAPAQVVGKQFGKYVENGIKPKQPLSELFDNGVSVYHEYPLSQASALISLESGSGKKGNREYWVCFDNFYVITRYNHSELYAMAAFQLGNAIVEQRRLSLTTNTTASNTTSNPSPTK